MIECHEVSEFTFEVSGITEFDNLFSHYGNHKYLTVALDMQLIDERFIFVVLIKETCHTPEGFNLSLDGIGAKATHKVAGGDNDIAVAKVGSREYLAVEVDVVLIVTKKEACHGMTLVSLDDNFATDANRGRDPRKEGYAEDFLGDLMAINLTYLFLHEIRYATHQGIDNSIPID